VDERPRYAHLVGHNPWVLAREEAAARSAAADSSETGEIPIVRRPDTDSGDTGGAGAGLVRSSAYVAAGTLLSRLTGLARVGALTYAVGALALGDAYNLANTTPNIVYELLLGGVLSATLVPVFVDRFDDGDDEAVSAVLTVATVALVALTALAVLAAPAIFAVYRTSEGVEAAGVPLLRLFLPQILFYGWTALGTAVLNARRRFAIAAFVPVLNNIVVCGALITFGLRLSGDHASLASVTDDRTGLLLLGVGTTAGIVAMTLPLWPAIRRAGVHLRWRFRPRHPAVVTVVRRAGWTLGYVAANQLGLTVMLSVAAATTEGLPSWYTYAFIFFQLPHGLVAVSIMTTFVPELASAWGEDDRPRYRERFGQGLRLVLTGVVPATVVLSMGATAIVAGLLSRGSFGPDAAEGTADVLRTMALGLPGFSAYLFALRGFYAIGDTRTPFLANIVENALQVGLTVLLVPGADDPAVMLGIAYAAAYSVAGLLAIVLLHRRVGGVVDGRGAGALVRLAASGAAAAVAVAAAQRVVGDEVGALAEAVAVAVVGLVAFLVVGAVVRLAEVRQLVGAVAGRRRSA
jgi:putative peptidoglycan lipid II flippase